MKTIEKAEAFRYNGDLYDSKESAKSRAACDLSNRMAEKLSHMGHWNVDIQRDQLTKMRDEIDTFLNEIQDL